MIRLAILALLLATPTFAKENKEEDCGYQADVVAAIQEARLKRVRQDKVADVIAASNPQWPENYNAAIPQFTAVVYELKRRDLRNVDLGEQWRTQCVDNWDKTQETLRNLDN
jgi:Xaa-Pro aminopeptidase